ncbi:hypothetical protein IE53DRAFT_52058 [Violaceomyces palustris]|uniref:Uncharacterized protein n=1 Tax=Violaceomyces palustris TaxID=1673888 RepID=A0ACD0NZW9_9BASI|nr:hypothetical protein IE53DRAFT_52058 [Violaceomyces palustris]
MTSFPQRVAESGRSKFQILGLKGQAAQNQIRSLIKINSILQNPPKKHIRVDQRLHRTYLAFVLLSHLMVFILVSVFTVTELPEHPDPGDHAQGQGKLRF